MTMKVLVACEYSGIVREAFAARGHDAWSCDLLPTDIPSDKHIQGDVLEIINDGWDLIIAHPPCTHLSLSGSRWWAEKRRLGLQQEAIKFVEDIWDADCPRICIEKQIEAFLLGQSANRDDTRWLRRNSPHWPGANGVRNDAHPIRNGLGKAPLDRSRLADEQFCPPVSNCEQAVPDRVLFLPLWIVPLATDDGDRKAHGCAESEQVILGKERNDHVRSSVA